MKPATVLLALGNRWRGDDAVGPAVLDRVFNDVSGLPGLRVSESPSDSLAMLSAWDGADRLLVVDAAVTGAAPGTVHRFDGDPCALPGQLAACSSHGLGLSQAIDLGRSLGRLPVRLSGWAVEAAGFDLGAPLSNAVSDAAAVVAKELCDLLSAPSAESLRVPNR